MATFIVSPASMYHPPVLGISSPVSCVTCGAAHDEDEDQGVTYDLVNGDPYCTKPLTLTGHSCHSEARDAAYRDEVSEMLTELLEKAMKKIEKLDKEYKGAYENDEHSPYTIIDDCLTRVKLFSEGKDTGWRNGLMLDYSEALDLRSLLDRAIFDKQWDVKQQLSKYASPLAYVSQLDVRLLASFGAARLALTAAMERTSRGAAL